MQTNSYYHENQAPELERLDVIKLAGEEGCVEAVGRKEVVESTSGEVLGRYEDHQPAAVSISVGKGRVIKVGTCLGAAMARTAKPALGENRSYTKIPGKRNDYFDGNGAYARRIYDSAVQDLILLAASRANARRTVVGSVKGIDAGLFEIQDTPGNEENWNMYQEKTGAKDLKGMKGAALLLANYLPDSVEKLTMSVPLSMKYSKVTTRSGKPVSVNWNKTIAQIVLSLDLIEVVEFKP